MGEEREHVAPGDLVRWLLMGLVVAIGIGLYLVVGADTPTVAQPAVLENAP
jgi:hypothetical protein